MNMTSVEAVVPPAASDYIYATEELTKLYKSINKSLLSIPIGFMICAPRHEGETLQQRICCPEVARRLPDVT